MTVALHVDQQRAEGLIGASDAPAILGLDKYRSPISVWRRMRGLDDGDDVPDGVREAAEWGQALEPVVRGRYALTTNQIVCVPSHSFLKDDWLRCTPDGLVNAHENHGLAAVVEMPPQLGLLDASKYRGLLQVKCRSAWQADNWTHGVPPAEEVQCRVEMAVCDLPWNDCAVLLGGNKMLVHRIERDLDIEERILRDLHIFWMMVQDGKEPSPDHTAAWRQHASEKMRPTKVVMQADDEMRELIEFWLAQRRKRKKAQEEEDAAKNDILLRMSVAGATGVQLDHETKVSAYKVGGRTDYKAYATDNLPCTAADLAKYKTEGNTWSLRSPKETNDD